MGIYYLAVDDDYKTKIEPPDSYANKTPGLYHPGNPFPAMVVMENTRGSHYVIIDDMGTWYEYACQYRDVTQEVYEELKRMQPAWVRSGP